MRSHESQPDYRFDLSGGVLCLDFANTLSRRRVPEQSIEHLAGYHDLVAFAEQSRILLPKQADDLRAHPPPTGKVQTIMRKALDYRENLYRAFSALAKGKPPASDDLQNINDFAVEALSQRRLARANTYYHWEWAWKSQNPVDSILWPIAQSAADLLTSPDLAAVRICEAPDCAWLFLDQSRNRSRRWCDMKVCGNRQKARRHYQRMHR